MYWIHATPSFFSPSTSQQSVRGHAGGRTWLQLRETKQPLMNMMEIPADGSPPACYTLPQRSRCTNFQAHSFPEGKTFDIAGAGLSSCPLQEAATKWWSPLGVEAGCCARDQLRSRHKGKLSLQSLLPPSFSLRLWHAQVKCICDKLSMIWLSYPLCSRLKQASAQDHTQHLCHIWIQ